MASEEVKHSDLFSFLREQNLAIKNNVANLNAIYGYVLEKWKLEEVTDDKEQLLKKKIKNFLAKLTTKFNSSTVRRTSDFLIEKESAWLNGIFEMPTVTTPDVPKEGESSQSSKKRGRPKKEFQELSDRGKRMRVTDNLLLQTTPEVLRTAQSKLHRKGLRTESSLISIMSDDHENAKSMMNLFTNRDPNPIRKIKRDEALASLMENSLSKQQYINMRVISKKHGADIWPVYKEITNAKKECYPHGIEANEVLVKVALQDLLNHTTSRILEMLTDVLKEDIGAGEYEIIYKWGMDGTSSQALYKQKFEDTDTETVEETSLLVISFVPLQLKKKIQDDEDITIWNNLRYSSPLFCRPLSLEFAKETVEKTKQCVGNIADQISTLQPTVSTVYGSEVVVNHRLIMSMINGKTCSAMTELSTQKCQICGCLPSEMNNRSNSDIHGDPASVGFNVSVLHTWIRVFENLIHIAYKLEAQEWRVTDPEKKIIVEARKKRIQTEFKAHSILVDFLLQGKGTTNDGNTARAFFRKATISAQITGLDEDLIRRFHNLLCAISSGQPLDVGRYHIYALETFDLYKRLYNWYFLSPHTHKLLLHSSFVIQHTLLPLGQLSEEASEAANKYIRRFRLAHTRKFSRKTTNSDLIKRLFVNSDPLISTLRKTHSNKKEKLPRDAANLLLDRPNEDEEEEDRNNEENFEDDEIEYDEENDLYNYSEAEDEPEPLKECLIEENRTSNEVEDLNKDAEEDD